MPTFTLDTLTPAIGARVQGLDLAAGLDTATRDALLAALLQHQVLFFEGQALTPAQQRDLAAGFGPLHIHPVYPQAPGVPESIRDRIFFPLVSGRDGGSGLGLTLAQTFVQQHQGIIECDSIPGKTIFKILIPIS